MLTHNPYKKPVLLFGGLFFAAQLIMAIVFYRERLFADTSYYIFHVINSGSLRVEHQRYILAASQLLPLVGLHLGASIKTVLILYSLNHVLFFLFLFLMLVIWLDDIYGGIAIIAVMVLNSLCLYVMPFLETWYSSGLLILFYALLNRKNKTLWHLLLILFLEITIIFSHPENLLVLAMFILLFMPRLKELTGMLKQRKTYVSNPVFLMSLVLALVFIYKALTLDKYESSQIGWGLHIGNTHFTFSGFCYNSVLPLIKSLSGYFKIPVLLLAMAIAFHIKHKQARRAFIVSAVFITGIISINFLFDEKTVTMYTSSHYSPIVIIAITPFFYDVLPYYRPRLKNIALVLISGIIVLRSVEQLRIIKPFTQSVENTERLINASDKVGGNKFFVNVPAIVSPYFDWTYPVQTLLLSAERGKDQCRTFATNEDTSVAASAKQIFTNGSALMLWRNNYVANNSLNPKYFSISPGVYKNIPYTDCLNSVFITHLNLNNTGRDWNAMKPDTLNGKPAVYFKGKEYGLVVTVPNDSLSKSGKAYYAIFSLTSFEPKTACTDGALVICSVTHQNKNEFYQSFNLNPALKTKDSISRTHTYAFYVQIKHPAVSQLAFYIWNTKKQAFYITGATLQLFKLPN